MKTALFKTTASTRGIGKGRTSRICQLVAWILCIVCLLGTFGCGGYPDKSADVPANWPLYETGDLCFNCEAGWSAADVSGFDEFSAPVFEVMKTTNQVGWLAAMHSSVLADGHQNDLAVSYFQLTEQMDDEALKAQLEQLVNIKSAFVDTGTTTFMLEYPEIGRYGENAAIYFSARFTLADDTKVVCQTGLVGHGDRLYQLTYLDYTSTEDQGQLRQILTSLRWKDEEEKKE